MKLALKSRRMKISKNLKEIKKNKSSKNKAEIHGFKNRKARDMITIPKGGHQEKMGNRVVDTLLLTD